MPDKLPDFPEHVLNGVEGSRPIHLGFAPLPEALDRMILGGIRLQMCQCDPVVLLEKLFDRSTCVPLGMVKDHDKQRPGEPLVAWREEGQQDLGCAPLGPFPGETLGPQMEGPEHRGALALRRGGHSDLCAVAKPPASDLRLMRKV